MKQIENSVDFDIDFDEVSEYDINYQLNSFSQFVSSEPAQENKNEEFILIGNIEKDQVIDNLILQSNDTKEKLIKMSEEFEDMYMRLSKIDYIVDNLINRLDIVIENLEMKVK